MNPDSQPEILRRLRCVTGHLNAVIKMAEGDEPCEKLLHQLHAVQGALRAVGLRLIACQLQSSQAIILGSSSANERLSELKRLQSLYEVFIQRSNQHNEVFHD